MKYKYAVHPAATSPQPGSEFEDQSSLHSIVVTVLSTVCKIVDETYVVRFLSETDSKQKSLRNTRSRFLFRSSG